MWHNSNDGKLYTEAEIKALYPNTSFGFPFNPSGLGWEVVFDTPQPTVTELQVAYQDGTEIDSKGNRVVKWSVRDMFADTPEATKAEQEEAYLLAKFKATVPQVITMRQAKLSLLNAGILTLVNTAIDSGSDEAIKIEWEYATEVRRDWESLIAMAISLGITSEQLDTLFIQASKL